MPRSIPATPRRPRDLQALGSTSSRPDAIHAARRGGLNMSRPWRAVVVDDHPKLLTIAARLLASIPGVEVVGEATSGQAALEAVDRLRPDLVLMDLTMPGMDGLEATRRLVARPDAPEVIIMTVHDLPQYRDAALAAGARRFVAKAELAEQLRQAILGLSSDLEAMARRSRDGPVE
jgi:DNA-binding NarL/FixJ family response regulator